MAMHPMVRLFMFVWFGGVIIIGSTIFFATLWPMLSGSESQDWNAWLGVIIPPAMLVFGYGLIRFGRYPARDEARFLTDFLIRTLDAREQNPGVTAECRFNE